MDIPTDYIITANGTYEFPGSTINPGLAQGLEYLIAFKPIGSASIAVSFNNGPAGTFVAADNGTFSSAKSEDRFIAPSPRMQLVVTGWTVPIKFSCAQLAR